uniref:Uncharacterized protein n=1 Tax=Siphoviridae sp. ctWhl2 TaxID=2827885 RepID=A0A8S5SBV5_9CAUD|nr:MAG TPA: hypothetical protein [Siphoviridae sp. ctWhl2]
MQQSRLFAKCCGHNIKGVFDNSVQHLVGDSPADSRRALGAESREHLLLLFSALPAAHDGQFSFFDQLQRQILDGGLVAKPDATDCQSNEAQQHQCNGDGRRDEIQHSFHDIASYKYQRRGEPPLRRFVVLVISDVSQVLGCPGDGLPAGRTADAIHGQLVLLLRFQQGVFGFFSKNAVRSQPQQPLKHLCCRSVCIPGTAPADGRQNEFQVGGRWIVLCCITQPRCLCVAGVRVNKSIVAVPVDAHTSEASFHRQNPQCHRVQTAIFEPPVCGHPIAMLAVRTAAHGFAGIVNNAAVAAGDFDGPTHLIPDDLKFLSKLRIYLLLTASTRTLELRPCKIFGQRGFVPALKRNNAHIKHSPKNQVA